ncbi:uncharacterized protein EI90DRAFT_3143985 [Cantharellus anzutake]|uniref:uncharacterized protein n=1 Tax=Cantharellus anzutake TaxID=1750568 RepID=UPI001907241D|nr:uncharacterized protein EI90DRAFT_3143985 [Cantharellus anzutake]KAF8339573.1 hypothetical protein EI90DRAFT_3143985 [Cantharellus anzutake]
MYTSEGHQHYEGATGSPLHPIAPGGSGSHIGSVPPQGRRYQTETNSPFPAPNISGPPPFRDAGGQGVWVGSAILEKSVHPCKLGPHLDPLVRVPYGGIEYGHYGRYDLLPVTEDHEWVPASYGHIPQGRRPVDGGYEESGERLHHAIAVIDGISVPGKTAPHLEGALVAFGNVEARVEEGYWIL